MRKPTLQPASVASALLAGASLSFGQQPVSEINTGIPVGLATDSPVLVGAPFLGNLVATDIVAGKSGSDLTGTDGGYPLGLANTHQVLFTTGAERGKAFAITAQSGSTLTLDGNVPGAVTDGVDQFSIVRLNTLDSLFGKPPSVKSGLQGDGTGTPANADRVNVGGVEYYYNSALSIWERTDEVFGGTDRGGTVIPNLEAVSVTASAASGTTAALVSGSARSVRAIVDIAPGTNKLSWPFPVETSLGDSDLASVLAGDGSGTPANADTIIINGVQYYYNTAFSYWERTDEVFGGNDRNGVILNPGGRGFIVLRTAGGDASLAVSEQFEND